MLTSLDPTAQMFVTAMENISQRMATAQRQLSTGLKVSTVADAPDSISTLLQVRADLAANQQIQSNLSREKTEVDGAEQGLETAVSLVEQARTYGTQGATATATGDSRRSLADQIGNVLEQLVGITQTSIEGRYIFSGDSDQTPSYTIDLSADPPLSSYTGGPANREVQHPNGSRFSVGKTAQDIFDASDPTQNVFSSLLSLRSALLANDQTAIANALPNVATSLTYLNNQLAFYGNVQNKVADATSYGSQRQLQLKTHLSSIQDADLTEAITELQQTQLQQTAALQAQARVPRTSLFDYLR
jgi:flagellar hook-associated protein 3 FlgL